MAGKRLEERWMTGPNLSKDHLLEQFVAYLTPHSISSFPELRTGLNVNSPAGLHHHQIIIWTVRYMLDDLDGVG
jgi:hypothetical protein